MNPRPGPTALLLAFLLLAPLPGARGQPVDELPPPLAGLAGRFSPPDAGEHAASYTCSFHWFRVADGRIVGLDVVRSDDTGRLALRLFLLGEDGSLRALVREAPADRWAPFAGAAPLDPDGPGDALGRGPGWVAARVRGAGPSIREAAFQLAVEPLGPGCTAGDFGLDFVLLSAVDFPRARMRGWLRIDGEQFQVDAVGPVSIHYGRSLPDYAWLATVPGAAPGPGLLLAATRGDNLRRGQTLAGERAFAYAHLLDLPGGSSHLKLAALRRLEGGSRGFSFPALGIPALGKRVAVKRVLASLPHELLGRPTTTFLAEVELEVPRAWPPLTRARTRVLAVGDVRGEPFLAHLDLPPPAAGGVVGGLERE